MIPRRDCGLVSRSALRSSDAPVNCSSARRPICQTFAARDDMVTPLGPPVPDKRRVGTCPSALYTKTDWDERRTVVALDTVEFVGEGGIREMNNYTLHYYNANCFF